MDGVLDEDDFQTNEDCLGPAEISFSAMGYKDAVNRFKRLFLEQTLRKVDGSRVEAARRLKLQRTYLSRLLKQHDVA
jgi:DNA-binding NtrC family response regulator